MIITDGDTIVLPLSFSLSLARRARAHGLFRREMIGEFELSLRELYKWPGHELHRKWLVLADPSRAAQGAQGYAQLSLTLLGPHDSEPAHDLDAEVGRYWVGIGRSGRYWSVGAGLWWCLFRLMGV